MKYSITIQLCDVDGDVQEQETLQVPGESLLDVLKWSPTWVNPPEYEGYGLDPEYPWDAPEYQMLVSVLQEGEVVAQKRISLFPVRGSTTGCHHTE